MLKIISITVNGNIMTMTVLIEGDKNRAYKLVVDTSDKEYYETVSSEIPDDCKVYEQQAKIALLNYVGKELPGTVTGMWY